MKSGTEFSFSHLKFPVQVIIYSHHLQCLAKNPIIGDLHVSSFFLEVSSIILFRMIYDIFSDLITFSQFSIQLTT